VTRAHIYNMIDRGELASVKLGKRRLIPAFVLEELLHRADTGTDQPATDPKPAVAQLDDHRNRPLPRTDG
jgi:excisionase family DNA binding protein